MFFFVRLVFASGSSLAKMTVVCPVACKIVHNLEKRKMRYYFLIEVKSLDLMKAQKTLSIYQIYVEYNDKYFNKYINHHNQVRIHRQKNDSITSFSASGHRLISSSFLICAIHERIISGGSFMACGFYGWPLQNIEGIFYILLYNTLTHILYLLSGGVQVL